jgi:hypothetical protein
LHASCRIGPVFGGGERCRTTLAIQPGRGECGRFLRAADENRDSAASEFNGTIKGSVDGHKIDVKAACSPDKKPWDWLRALSDPAHRPESLRDPNGDGIAIVAGTSRSMGGATFSTKVGETFDKFSGGRRSTTFDDNGFRVVGKFDRPEGEGKDRKVVNTDR